MKGQEQKRKEIEEKYGKPFGEVLKELVATKGQKGAATELGMHRSTVWYWVKKQKAKLAEVDAHVEVNPPQAETGTQLEQ